MTGRDQIAEHMPVFCAGGQPHSQVDRMDGESIKLTKDDLWQHHLRWLTWMSMSIST